MTLPTRRQSVIASLLDVLLRNGGYTVQLVEALFDEAGSHAFFDESGSDDGSPVLCVAGFIIEKEKCKQMDDDWVGTLKKYNLPYFRMSPWAQGTEPFD